MKILPKFDLDIIKAAIASDFPELKIKKITLIDNGWDNVVVEINDNMIFRFPKDNKFTFYKNEKTSFDTEVEILGILKNKISLQIPQIEFLGKSFTYMGYPKIHGGNLTTEIFDSLNSEQKEKLTFDLANFLREIHASISPDEARKIGVVNEDLPSYSRSIKSVLPNKINNKSVLNFVEATVEEYESLIQEKVELVFLYNDLHTENMAFDATAKKLNGVFDFGDIMVGDVNMDFYPLYKFDPYFMKAVAGKYQKLTGRKLNLRRMVIYGRINELSDLAELIDQPESAVYKNAIIRIEKWNLEMDLFKE
ncbi:MAG: aminoglycoside phosphotransferase family protein [Candidatus Sungbacteria bacterium]|nr:aminoglycoside phosphotransferase family protein [Candidatus Sungbacteria bacterium]